MRNSKAMLFDLFPFFVLLLCSIPIFYVANKATRIIGFIMIAFFAILQIAMIPYFIRMIYDGFYYDEEKNEIILKRFRQKDRRIPLENIEKIISKRNDDDRMGALSGKGKGSQHTFSVKSREGYDYFFITNDPAIEKFFANHGIPMIRYDEEET
jgi:hypothetical protein